MMSCMYSMHSYSTSMLIWYMTYGKQCMHVLMEIEQSLATCCAGLAFQLDHHQHAEFADKILQILGLTFSYPVAQASEADPSDLHTAVWLYMWAVATSHAQFSTHRSKTTEACLIQEIDDRLCGQKLFDFHSDPGPRCNHNCSILTYHNGVADKIYRCDHVFPKRRKPTVERDRCTMPVDTLIGEGKWWKCGTKSGVDDTSQKHAETEHVRSGYAKCLIWWCARYASLANMTWLHTKFEVTFSNAQDCFDCKQRLSSLGLTLHWLS